MNPESDFHPYDSHQIPPAKSRGTPAGPEKGHTNPTDPPEQAGGSDPKGGKRPSGSRRSRRAGASDLTPSQDISPLLKGWDFEPGTINVRKIDGHDCAPKLQLRLDLGLLQMELSGRPDGDKPHGCESLLDYLQDRLDHHRRSTGGDEGFRLTPQQCQQLREEAVMYYHRYLSLFVLGDFKAVVRDTARNLRVLDFCGRFATDDHDRVILEQYRPYIVMMNTRAAASVELKRKRYAEALTIVRRGLRRIKRFFRRFGQEEVYRQSGEVRVLKRFAREIRDKVPVDPLEKLQKELKRAIETEAYEHAATLHERIERLKASRDHAA